jgi:uncharacterized protein YjfI (DUF2170 family)
MSQATNIALKTLIENALNQNEVAEYLKPVVIDADWATLNHASLEGEELLISLSNDQLSVCVILAKTDEIKDTLNCQTEMLRATAVMPLAEFCIMSIDGVDCYVLSGHTGLSGDITAATDLFIEQVNAVATNFEDAMELIAKFI